MPWLPVMALVALVAGSADDGEAQRVRLRAAPADEVIVAGPTIDQLGDGDVLIVHLSDGVPNVGGTVRQCTVTVTGFDGCANRFPVQFGDEGQATFQYQLVDPGGCDGAAACAVVVGDEAGERVAYAFTVFGGSAPPPPAVTLTPSGPYEPGDDVRVDVSSLLPDARIRAAFCATSCGPSTASTADGSGTAAVKVAIGDRCRDCGVVVVAGASSSLVPVDFVPPPSPAYDTARLVAGLAAAAAFLLAARRIVATVDWRPPSEAQIPDVDLSMPD